MNKSLSINAQYQRNKTLLGKACPIEFNYHKAAGKEIKFKEAPSKFYNKGNLTDGQKAHFPRINNEWLAWSGQNMEASLNLNDASFIESIDLGFLKNEQDWIYLPSQVEIFISLDNIHFVKVDTQPSISEINGKYNYHYAVNKLKAQYINIIATCAPNIETGKPGEGKNAWLFSDEIEIQ